MTNVDLDSFSHGQIKSKLWLCQELEKYLPDNPKLTILGCWYNVLSFMLLTRNPDRYVSITGIDIDSDAIDIANKINNAFTIDDGLINHITHDANNYSYIGTNVVINCSGEHMSSNKWFENIPYGTIVCVQSSNVIDTCYPWSVTNPSPDIDSFAGKYSLSKTYFLDILPIRYKHSQGYDRYMLIGIK
jgi:hypothetical protein